MKMNISMKMMVLNLYELPPEELSDDGSDGIDLDEI